MDVFLCFVFAAAVPLRPALGQLIFRLNCPKVAICWTFLFYCWHTLFLSLLQRSARANVSGWSHVLALTLCVYFPLPLGKRELMQVSLTGGSPTAPNSMAELALQNILITCKASQMPRRAGPARPLLHKRRGSEGRFGCLHLHAHAPIVCFVMELVVPDRS